MSTNIRHIPIRSLGSSPVHLRYLDEDPDLEQFLGRRPRNPTDLLKRAPVNARRLVSAGSLSDALTAYAETHEAPPEALANAAAIAEGDAHMVVTGQQPGLFGGPLYTVFKAATAVRLAREINATPGSPRTVPIFWNHTDDHDLEEVNRAFFINNNLEVQRLRLDVRRDGEAIRDIGVGHNMEHVLAAVGDMLPRSDFREAALEIFRPRQPDEQLGSSLARLLFSMFGRHGLLVIEPRDLPEEAFSMLPRWWEQASEIQASNKSTIEVLVELGLDTGLDPSATLMFQKQGGRRAAMAAGDPVNEPCDLSPGVLLRPLWQDACLPTLSTVVGPGELSYLSVAGPLYRQLGVPAPVLAPRASLTLVEPSLARLLKRFGWDIPDLDAGPETLAASITSDGSSGDESGLEGLIGEVKDQMQLLIAAINAGDPQMVRTVERTKGKVHDELSKLLNKLRNSRQNKEGTGMRQIRRVTNSLRPKGRPQERILTVLPFLAAHGPKLADLLVDAADPFTTGHGVLEL